MKKRVYILLGFISVFSIGASAQNISTKAGSVSGGYSGDGGQATSAQLLAPAGVSLDAAGNIYIADEYNNCIRKVNTSGVISTVAGKDTAGFSGDGGDATAAKLNHPTCVVVDAAGNMYIADKENNRIRKVTASGTISTIAGTGMQGFSGEGDTATQAMLNRPNCVAVDTAGNVYIADRYNNRVRKIKASTGIITTVVGNGWGGYNGDYFPIATMASLDKPQGVAISPAGHLYIADTDNDRIRNLDMLTGKVTTVTCISGAPPYHKNNTLSLGPTSIAFDGVGNMYVADQYHYLIKKVDSNGTLYIIGGNYIFGYSGDGGNAKLAKLSLVKGIAADAAGNVYIADQGNNRVRYITTTVDAKMIKAQTGGVSVYPNPSQSGRFTLNISSAMSEKVAVFVTDLSGKVVYSMNTETNKQTQIELNQPSGMYVIKAYSADKSWAETVNILN